MSDFSLSSEQRVALDAFLLTRCRKGGCEGPWCEIQKTLAAAFGYPVDWKDQKKIEAHHQALIELSLDTSRAVSGVFSSETLEELVHQANKITDIASCLYNNYYRPPPVVLQRGEDFKERIAEVMNSKASSFVVVNEEGTRIMSGGFGDAFDSTSFCEICCRF